MQPSHVQTAELARARAAYAAGRREEGVQLLERALASAPDFAEALSDLGAMLIGLGRPLEAAARLRTAVDLDPGSVEARVNLANALHAQGELAAAEAAYRETLQLAPRHPRGCLSFGNLLVQLRRPAEALEWLQVAAAGAPQAAAVHVSLANALRDLGRIDEALEGYRRAIALEPANPEAHENLGNALRARGQLEEALAHLRAAGTAHARALALDCLLRLGRHDEFFADVAARREAEATNLHSASLCAYAAFHLGRPDPHPFCPDPLAQVRIVDRYTRPGADAQFLADLVAEAGRLNAVWEPRGVTTKRGYQTGGNLFDHGLPALTRLARDLGEELQRYRDGLLPQTMGLALRWPMHLRLHGWFVRLLRGGHQHFHNHPFGWVSGCLYLKMPAAAPPGEGAIEFGLGGDGYPPLSARPAPTLLHEPKAGQLALFPSSLYHRTIPFGSDEERLCIAFDLLPG